MIWVSSRWKILLMVAPALLVFTGFVIYPVLYSLGFSFTRFQGFGAPEWIGFDNYVALAADPFFWQVAAEHDHHPVVSLAILIPSSFALALLLRRRIAGGGTLRALVFGPAIIAPILVGLIWVFILDPKIGLLNRVLGFFGVGAGAMDRRRHADALCGGARLHLEQHRLRDDDLLRRAAAPARRRHGGQRHRRSDRLAAAPSHHGADDARDLRDRHHPHDHQRVQDLRARLHAHRRRAGARAPRRS